ncbi:MAG: hypothetical protein AB1453_02230 [Chloroflexota bacterium]
MKGKYRGITVAAGFCLIIGLLLAGSSLPGIAQAKTSEAYAPSAATLDHYAQLRDLEARLDAAVREEGWLRYSYTQRMQAERNPYYSADAQMPAEAEFEIWFHFNAEGLVDQQATFLLKDGKRTLTEIYAHGIYRSMAESFTSLPQQPYSPSFYFYLGREDPRLAAQEGVHLTFQRGAPAGENLTRFVIERQIGSDSPLAGSAEPLPAIRHVLWVDTQTAQPVRVENYQLLEDGRLDKFHEISQIEYQRMDSLPQTVQSYFDDIQ